MIPRFSLLLIGHTYAAVENRKKVAALAAHFDVVCVTSTIETREILGQSAAAFDDDSDAPARQYELVRCRAVGGSNTTFRYEGLADVMRSRQFDVVLVENEPWAVVCWQARLLKGRLQPQALFGQFTWENVERPAWKGALLKQVYRAMAATTDFVIAGNNAASDLVCDHGLPKPQILVAPQLGVDLTNHQPASADEKRRLRRAQKLPEDQFIVGYCGRFTEEKGLHELIEAGERLALTHPNVGVALLGAGRMLPWLQDQERQHAWLHLLPPRPHTEIPSFLRALDVLVLGSKPVRTMQECWEEQFGHVLIEAMACGVVTTGSTSGAIPEVLGDPAVVFPWGDVQALTDLLFRLHDSAAERTAIACRQLHRARTRFTHEAVAAEWARFLQKQLAA